MSIKEMTIQESEEPPDTTGGHRPSPFWVLALGSIGVVYGDIGTSPLYALREAVVAAADGKPFTSEIVFGILSLIFWALIIVVTIKYVFILLNADNEGEGGTLSLMALAQRTMGKNLVFIPMLGMIGAALFYGDAMITPAISVLSAIEGLKIITPAFEPYVLPITLFIIVALFAAQVFGTGKVAGVFGPITLVWFLAIAAAGVNHINDYPGILGALNPLHAVSFMVSHGMIGLVALGAVFLAVTGAEALYADLGHFGRSPIKYAWLVVVLPALMLNYLGQGAFLLKSPEAIENPFFLMVPEWSLMPMVALATAATIIASQAVITGAYSLTRQAMQLGLLPRLQVRFTSEKQAGQIYMPNVNWFLMAGVLVLVIIFQTSSSLASAYGIAVTGTMVVTATMAIFVIWKHWRWPLWASLALMLPLLALDLVFFGANALKILHGGWVPLAIAAGIILLMWTWRRGSAILFDKSRRMEVPLQGVVDSLQKRLPHQVPGNAVFFTSDPESAPTALMHSLKHYKVLHENNVVLTIRTSQKPVVPRAERLEVHRLGKHFTSVVASFGYMEDPSVPKLLQNLRGEGLKLDLMTTSFFLSRRSVRASKHSGMPYWQDKLFIMLARNADDASHYFRLPAERVVEVGTQITI